jgi:hypothetical protein
MRLQTVAEPPGFVAVCLGCGRVIPAGTTKIADLDGPAFKAYYHTTCVSFADPKEESTEP